MYKINIVSANQKYQELEYRLKEIADLRYASGLLQWDQETYMPPAGAEIRARQVATLSEMAHSLFTGEELRRILEQLKTAEDLTEDQQHNLRLVQEDVEKSRKLPSSFVRKLSETVSNSFSAWIEARRANSFKVFQSSLEELVKLKREEAEMLGYTGHPYNALLNDYEKGCTVDLLDKTFATLREPLGELLGKIAQRPQVDNAFLNRHYPRQAQWDYILELLRNLNYDMNAGRQDISEHPFTINFGSRDVRITTRIDENDLGNMVWSSIHEAGHALYEQGLPYSEYGMPLGEAASLSIHESQSRLWENNVGRGLPFWKHHFPALLNHFPNQLADVSLEKFYQGINQVKPSLIRTEADELTYHFHVMIRYELEKELIGGQLEVNDIPEFWNQGYKNYLGIDVPDDKQGCLQDVHWSHGSFGYFPTYSLGSLYAAQFYRAAEKAIPALNESLAQGDCLPLLGWLRSNIHIHGRKYTSEQLSERITGEGLNTVYFMEYANDKYSFIYNINR